MYMKNPIYTSLTAFSLTITLVINVLCRYVISKLNVVIVPAAIVTVFSPYCELGLLLCFIKANRKVTSSALKFLTV